MLVADDLRVSGDTPDGRRVLDRLTAELAGFVQGYWALSCSRFLCKREVGGNDP